MKKHKNKIKNKNNWNKIKITISLLTLVIIAYCLFIFANMYNSIYSPTSPKVDIAHILKKPLLNENDYSLIFTQTGLAKPAVDDLLSQSNGINKVISYQDSYYTKHKFYVEKLNLFTSQESIMVNSTNNYNSFQIAPLKNGDILLTKSTRTLYWRHGHCGIVIDASKGITLESLEPGTISMQQNISKWQSYPTFKLMRLKNVDQKKLDEIAQYAVKNLTGIGYSMFAKKSKVDKLTSVNCSQLIYQAFIQFGYDLDCNSGIFITPENIAKSDLLSIVQIYGFNPKKDW